MKQCKLHKKTRVCSADQSITNFDGIFSHVTPECVYIAFVRCHHGLPFLFSDWSEKCFQAKRRGNFSVNFSHQKKIPLPFTSVTIFTSGEIFKCP